MSQHSIYLPLDRDQRDIRVLTIFPESKSEAVVRCSLKIVSLDQNPQFEAISYVWGRISDKTDIIINDILFYVTPNLEAILRRLRRRKEKRVVWVDFLCINQNNTSEKNNQVALMGQIYAGASSVIAMMGVENACIDLAVSWTERYIEKRLTTRTLHWWKLDFKEFFSSGTERERQLSVLDAYEGVLDIEHAPYWTRAWTFQEFQLARDHPICMSGNSTFNAETLIYSSAPRLLGSSRQTHKNPRQRNPMNIGRVSQSGYGIIELLMRTYSRQCQDPRDKFFSLHSLVPGLRAAHPPDYNKSFHQVMLETAAYAIEQEGAINILGFMWFRADHLYDTSLPSWVPNLTAGEMTPRYYMDTPLQNTQSPDEGRMPRVTGDLSTLHLWAHSAGSCSPILTFKSDMERILRQIASFIKMTDSIWKHVWDLGILIERFICALTALWETHSAFPMQEILDTIAEMARSSFEKKMPLTTVEQTECWKSLEMELCANYGKVLFFIQGLSSHGIGIGCSELQEGDLVVVAPGVEQPLVLRKGPNLVSETGQAYYQLIGHAFVERLGVLDNAEINPLLACLDQPLEEYLIH